MVNEVFPKRKVASQEIWTEAEDMTELQKAVPVVARWVVVKKLDSGSMQAVDSLTGQMGEYTAGVVVKQSMELDDVIEVREGVTRDQDVNVHYRRADIMACKSS